MCGCSFTYRYRSHCWCWEECTPRWRCATDMARIRNTKKLSQRIDREYFKRLYPIPRWRRLLSIVATGIGLAWVLARLQ